MHLGFSSLEIFLDKVLTWQKKSPQVSKAYPILMVRIMAQVNKSIT
jgi:hypothetical protein